MTRHRWICPRCGNGKLGSSRPRKNATVRYCLPCSDKTGYLVERECPALQRTKQAKANVRKKRQQIKRKQVSAQLQRERQKLREIDEFKRRARERTRLRKSVRQVECFDGDLQPELDRLWKICRRLSELDLPTDPPALSVARRERAYTSGHAYYGPSPRITLTLGPVDTADAYGVLAHEVAHHGVPSSTNHKLAFWNLLVKICREAYDVDLTVEDVMREPRNYNRQCAVEHAIRMERQRKGL